MINPLSGMERLHLLRIYAKEKEVMKGFEEVIGNG